MFHDREKALDTSFSWIANIPAYYISARLFCAFIDI